MIEVIHFRNRFGKHMCGVLEVDRHLMSETPAGAEYAKRYAAGLEAPFYPVPVPYSYTMAHKDTLNRMWYMAIVWVVDHA